MLPDKSATLYPTNAYNFRFGIVDVAFCDMENGRSRRAVSHESFLNPKFGKKTENVEFRLSFIFNSNYLLGRSTAPLKLAKAEELMKSGRYQNILNFKAPWTGDFKLVPSKFYSDSPVSLFINDQMIPEEHFPLKYGESINLHIRCDREAKISDNKVIDVRRSSYFETDYARAFKDLYCIISCTINYPCYVYVYGTKVIS